MPALQPVEGKEESAGTELRSRRWAFGDWRRHWGLRCGGVEVVPDGA